MGLGIKCTVESCAFNRSSLCDAETIEVSSSMQGSVSTSDETLCETFRPRG